MRENKLRCAAIQNVTKGYCVFIGIGHLQSLHRDVRLSSLATQFSTDASYLSWNIVLSPLLVFWNSLALKYSNDTLYHPREELKVNKQMKIYPMHSHTLAVSCSETCNLGRVALLMKRYWRRCSSLIRRQLQGKGGEGTANVVKGDFV
jgi:hypothetical protein